MIYTREVIGNIKESYNMPYILLGTFIPALIITTLFMRSEKSLTRNHFKWKYFIGSILLVCLVFFRFDVSLLEISSNHYANEVSKNGLYELFSAFRNNELSFEKFYPVSDQKKLTEALRRTIQEEEPDSVFLNKTNIARYVNANANEKKLNVILIAVESLSASFLKYFGDTDNLTPNINALVNKSLCFTNILATGTRTVYGLAAINLSIPPLPGNSIIRRPNNENLSTLGSILRSKGYDCKFIYGGFGYFDNMNYFFENNGYKVIDRNSIGSDEVTFANIWGICDEDLLDVVLRRADESHKFGMPFFSMVMTTSNHRPFTYPDGKIDIPSKTGRSGGVKYTDYAIGNFLKKAETRRWYEDTLFVITADHTANSAGEITLDPTKYHIPLLIFAPKYIGPRMIPTLASQIDIAPTIISLLGISYESKFFGHNALDAKNERAFISNYQQIGFMTNSELLVLLPVKRSEKYKSSSNGLFVKDESSSENLLSMALQYLQSADNWREWNRG
ncbi:MAG: sulfatase-like hydrolase/transferase [Holosporales bacterium]|nr:sulfatase-like hydrolase/transferase [Holosporales bacterium]